MMKVSMKPIVDHGSEGQHEYDALRYLSEEPSR